jgi:hypothetical protein
MKWVVMLMLALPAPGLAAADGARDRFGGWPEVRATATGYFHTEPIAGVWWLVTPDGDAFFCKGVSNVSYSADVAPALGYAPYGRATQAKYGSADKWAAAAADRLRGWGFNSVGAWSSPEMRTQHMPYVLIANMAAGAPAYGPHGEWADFFAPQFAVAVRKQAQELCAPHADDPFLLGYFTDNELRWGPDWSSKTSLLDEFLALPAEAAGRQAAVALMRARYTTVEALNTALGTRLGSLDELAKVTSLPAGTQAVKELQAAFHREYAHRYFEACREAILAADPHHLVLGCRFNSYAPAPVAEAMGPYVDVVSINSYFTLPMKAQLTYLAATTGKPVMVTEFSFKARDSGLPNTSGDGRPVATQQDRADGFDNYVTALAKMPFVVGFHWFEYADEPAEGRFDGENSNYGLVNIKDEPWQILVERMTHVNAGLEVLHRAAAR